jgi:hypothetical protein
LRAGLVLTKPWMPEWTLRAMPLRALVHCVTCIIYLLDCDCFEQRTTDGYEMTRRSR